MEKACGGHSADKSIFHNQELWEKYACPVCDLLLKDAVQTSCGHWGCESCVNNLLATESLPRCRNKDCREELKDEDGAQFFKDRIVRREILNLLVNCDYKEKGCAWTGKFQEREAHLKVCEHNSTQCELCGETIAAGMAEEHRLHLCPKAVIDCPYQILGCSNKSQMPKSDMKAHLHENQVKHARYTAKSVSKINSEAKETQQKVNQLAFRVEMLASTPSQSGGQCSGFPMEDQASSSVQTTSIRSMPAANIHPTLHEDHSCGALGNGSVEEDRHNAPEAFAGGNFLLLSRLGISNPDSRAPGGRHREDARVVALKERVLQLEKTLHAKTAEAEDRDFRLSLIENSNYDGNLVWKIPQFSQRKADAESGKYTSIFSLPFYTGRYGYKMCLRLYILGDGVGKNSHMSLFFVVMRGEFDNILQWPFAHKVTFKLINQKGARDVIDTFQPDPMSSSFRKPKSDMNIASGCLRFVSYQELQNGFLEDDTIFIKCIVDTRELFHP